MTYETVIGGKPIVSVRWLWKTLRLAWNLRCDPGRARDIGRELLRGRFARAGRMVRTASRSPKVRNEAVASRKFRCLWLPNSKVASRSVRVVLHEADPDAVTFVDKSVAEICADHPEVMDYYSFAFIRHPFERALSFYAHLFLLSLESYPEDQFSFSMAIRREVFRHFHGLEDVRSFDDYCDWLNTPWGSDRFADRHFRSQHVQIRLPDGRLPDFVGRLENIGDDFERVAGQVGMPRPTLPMRGTRAGWSAPPDAVESARAAMRAHLTARNRALLAARYEGDLKLYRSLCGERPALPAAARCLPITG